MHQDRHSNDFIPTFRFPKTEMEADQDDGGIYRQRFTEQNNTYEAPESPRPRFQNYLRATYPFQTATTPSPASVTLPLKAGDIVLVHSVHTNGWADGTLLENGARGWLPTNYCKPYDYAAMRPSLRALTEFWDIVRNGSVSNLAVFHNQDYMRGIVAGVRFLLEKSNCLTRESALVKKHDVIRRARRSLLSDLSTLVKAAKRLQQIVTSIPNPDLDETLDDMLLKAFRIVTRAVRFYDVWTDELVLNKSMHQEDRELEIPPFATASTTFERSESQVSSNVRFAAPTSRYSTIPAIGTYPPRRPTLSHSKESSISVPQSLTTSNSGSLTHRVSYNARTARPTSTSLASEVLNHSYDEFLGVLALFLGSHLQSRSSAELLLTTQQAVKSCRQLLAVVEQVIGHDYASSSILMEAKELMYDAITDLVHAARHVFRPIHTSEEDLEYLPEEGRHLVQAATNCVSCAGRCIAKTKSVLEEVGDFELDTPRAKADIDSDHAVTPVQPTHNSSPERAGLWISGISASQQETSRVEAEHMDLANSLLTPPLSTHPGDSPSTLYNSIPPTPVDELPESGHKDSSSAVRIYSARNSAESSESYNIPLAQLQRQKSVGRTVIPSTSSAGTYGYAARNSDPSEISITSTRATSIHEIESHDSHFVVDSKSETLQGDEVDEDGEAEVLERTFAHELLFNREGQIVGGTLNGLIERLTSHDSTPDALFISTIYLTFRLFAKPEEFAEALVYRYQYAVESSRLAAPVRLRVYNVFKGWLESHWRHDCDDVALPIIVGFARESLNPILPSAGKRLLELTDTVASIHGPVIPRVVSTIGKTNTSSASYINPDSPLPAPVISKSQLTALRTWKMGGAGVGILDFDALELARQITLKTSRIYCSILPEELLATEWTKQSSSLAVNVRAMSTLSTDLSNLVTDSILQLEEPKKRAAIIKQWIKVATKCLELNNYDTIWAIVCSLDSTNIKRMKRTWEVVPQKTKASFDELKTVVDVSKNYSALRQRVAAQVPPCLPFLGVYLTDLTMVDHANQATRPLSTANGTIPVINLYKHMGTAKLISDLQRFQIPYRLAEVSELQTWMQDQLIRVRSAGEKNFQNHYRRSLVLEPKEQQRLITQPSSSKEKERFDFLAWTHIIKDKPIVPAR